MNTRINRITRIAIATAAAASTLGLVGVGTASAKAGDVVVTGDCSARTDYKLKVGARDGGFEYEFEVDQNVNRQLWNVTVKDNAVTLFNGTKRTKAPSGSFNVQGRAANQAGADVFVATATNPKTGETCTATITA